MVAKLTLTIDGKTAEIEVKESVAIKVRDRAWDAYHRGGETATDKEKVDWLVDTILRSALTQASARKDKVEEREARRIEHETRRVQRTATRGTKKEAQKFE